MAVENRYQIDVNMKSRMFRDVPEVVANDKVIFEITVYDGPLKFPLSAAYTYHLTSLKLGGQSVIREGTLSGEVIVFELGTSEMTVPGKVEGTVQIFDENNDRISSSKFDYVVKRDPSLQGSLPADDTTLVIANESLLTEAITKADNADNRINNIVAQAGTDNTEIVDMRLRTDGTVAPTAGGHLRELSDQLAEKAAKMWIDVKEDWGLKGDGTTYEHSLLDTKINEVLASGKKGVILFFNEGTYLFGTYLQSVRQETVTAIKDLNNLIILGTGEKTVFKGISDLGFDVFQLNGVKNLTLKNFDITSIKNTADTTQGCNGVSMTNGTNHITIEGVNVDGLPYVVKTNYVDGGKAFTIQTGTNPVEDLDSITIKNCKSKNVAFGFGMDVVGTNAKVPTNLKVYDNEFNAFYRGIYVSASAPASGNYIDRMNGIIENNTVIGAQQAVVLSRASGIKVRNNPLISMRTGLPTEVSYDTSVFPITVFACEDTIVEDNQVHYAECDNFVKLENAASGKCRFIHIKDNKFSGLSKGVGVKSLNSANTGHAEKSVFMNNQFRGVTGSEYDATLYAAALSNIIMTVGEGTRFEKLGVKTTGDIVGADEVINGILGFAYTDGKTAYNFLQRVGTALAIKQTVSGTATTELFKFLSNTDADLIRVLNNGELGFLVNGQGIVFKSPDGLTKKKLTIDNTGNAVWTTVP